MRVSYSTLAPSQGELDMLPWLSLVLKHDRHEIEATGLVDSGATVNVLPYGVGLQLGGIWDDHRAVIGLAGNLGRLPAMPLFVTAQVGDFSPTVLAFAWSRASDMPLILGQMKFFMEFDVGFYRSRLEFDVMRAAK